MNRKVPGLATFFVGLALVGCGGNGPSYPDAKVNPDARSDAGAKETGTDAIAKPMPATTSKVLIPGNASLIGSGADSCSNQDPAPGDRWCAFTRPGTTLGFNDLWVINVSKAAMPGAAAIKCDTSDASCLRLSTGLYEDPSISFRLHGFDGDTLIYYEEPTHSANGFVGVVKAWRPGWTAGRKLTADTGVVCAGHKKSAAALCFENVFTDAAQTVRTADLHVGVLTDQAGGLLPKVDTLLIGAKDDAAGVRKWRADLSADGKRVAWSTRTDAAGVEILKQQAIGDDTSRKTVAEDVSVWTMTADGAAWLWLRKFNYDQNGAPAGTLETAPFPDGTGAKVLAMSVGDYSDVGTKGVLFRSKVSMDAGDLVLMPDRDVPATIAMLDQGVLFVFDQSKDGTKAVYTKNAASISAGLSSAPVFDLFVAANDGKRPCTLAATPIGFLPPDFLGSGDFTAWGRLNSVTGEVEGMYTTLSTCTTKKFATEVFSWTPIGSEGYVFLDDLSLDPSLNEASLRYSKLTDGALPTQGTLIQTRAQFTYATLLPTLPAVIYNVSSGEGNDGLYINASLPFTTSPVVPPADAGAPVDTGTPSIDAPAETGGNDAATAPETGGSDAGADADLDAAQAG